MKFEKTAIPDVILAVPQVFGDQRGFFMETYHAQKFKAAGIDVDFVQDNHSGSRKGTLRGLHYQVQQIQEKLVRCISGEIYDVAVDIRRSSPTFGKWVGTYLTAENRHMMWLPEGFAHGYYVLSEWAEIMYKTTNFYAPQWERSLLWNDPAIGIDWPLLPNLEPLLSDKDKNAMSFSKADLFE